MASKTGKQYLMKFSDKELHAKVKESASKAKRQMNGHIEFILEKYFKEEEGWEPTEAQKQ
ncbi:MAG: hypothetical protein HQL69_18560 [Magnetococcales bacterium]|nr:hypothetical protein [Magnetococcales bacterium]